MWIKASLGLLAASLLTLGATQASLAGDRHPCPGDNDRHPCPEASVERHPCPGDNDRHPCPGDKD